MEQVYVLQHSYETPDGDEEIKLIGVYSSQEAAQAAIERLSTQPGFKDRPEGFHIDQYRIDQDHWTEGYTTVAEALAAIPD